MTFIRLGELDQGHRCIHSERPPFSSFVVQKYNSVEYLHFQLNLVQWMQLQGQNLSTTLLVI